MSQFQVKQGWKNWRILSAYLMKDSSVIKEGFCRQKLKLNCNHS